MYLVSVTNSSDIHNDINVEYTPSLVEISEGVAVDIYVGGTSILSIINTLT